MVFFVSSRKCQWSFNFFQKQYVLEKLGLWSKNLNANQNAGVFTLEYLKYKLRYDEVELLDVVKGQWKQQILVACFKQVSLDIGLDEEKWVGFLSRMSWIIDLIFLHVVRKQ